MNLKEALYELRKGEWELRERPIDKKSVEQKLKEELYLEEAKTKVMPDGEKPKGWRWFEKTADEVLGEIWLVYGLSEWELRRVVR